ncbi:MAG: ABA4-like family protein [Pseudomonadota bacterium]
MVDAHTLFSWGDPLVLVGWAALILSPLAPVWADRIAGFIIPAILSLAYTGLILAFWSGAPGGFDSLENVMALFTDPYIALAGWLHFLAFDLFVGAWIVRQARAAAIPHLLTVPILVPAFLFAPAGYLAFITLRAIWSLRTPAAQEA